MGGQGGRRGRRVSRRFSRAAARRALRHCRQQQRRQARGGGGGSSSSRVQRPHAHALYHPAPAGPTSSEKSLSSCRRDSGWRRARMRGTRRRPAHRASHQCRRRRPSCRRPHHTPAADQASAAGRLPPLQVPLPGGPPTHPPTASFLAFIASRVMGSSNTAGQRWEHGAGGGGARARGRASCVMQVQLPGPARRRASKPTPDPQRPAPLPGPLRQRPRSRLTLLQFQIETQLRPLLSRVGLRRGRNGSQEGSSEGDETAQRVQQPCSAGSVRNGRSRRSGRSGRTALATVQRATMDGLKSCRRGARASCRDESRMGAATCAPAPTGRAGAQLHAQALLTISSSARRQPGLRPACQLSRTLASALLAGGDWYSSTSSPSCSGGGRVGGQARAAQQEQGWTASAVLECWAPPAGASWLPAGAPRARRAPHLHRLDDPLVLGLVQAPHRHRAARRRLHVLRSQLLRLRAGEVRATVWMWSQLLR